MGMQGFLSGLAEGTQEKLTKLKADKDAFRDTQTQQIFQQMTNAGMKVADYRQKISAMKPDDPQRGTLTKEMESLEGSMKQMGQQVRSMHQHDLPGLVQKIRGWIKPSSKQQQGQQQQKPYNIEPFVAGAPPQKSAYPTDSEQLHQADTDSEQLHQADIEQQIETKEYDSWIKRGKELGLTGRDLAEYSGSKGQRLPATPHVTNKPREWVQSPDDADPQKAYVDPDSPSGYSDYSGNPLPMGTRAVATPVTQRLYGDIQYLYWEARSRGLSDIEAKEEAGKKGMQLLGIRYGRQIQQAEIDQALSGIAMPQNPLGMPSKPDANIPKTPKEAKDRVSALGGGGATNKAPENKTGIANLTPEDNTNLNVYLGSLFGTQKSSARGSMVRMQKGQQVLARITGLDPITLNAELMDNKATAKALYDAIQVSGAFGRVQETLKEHGKVLAVAAKAYDPTGSPLINRTWQWIQGNSAAHPQLQRLTLALNAVQREYARMIAGGVQSRAMLPVTSEEKGEQVLRKDMTLKDILASIDQLKIEADTEQKAFGQQQQELKDRLKRGPIGKSVGADQGKTLTLEEAKEYLKKAGGDKNKARDLAKADGRTF